MFAYNAADIINTYIVKPVQAQEQADIDEEADNDHTEVAGDSPAEDEDDQVEDEEEITEDE